MNPWACGFLGNPQQACGRTPTRIRQYRGWLSDAKVDVTIYRPGKGEVDSNSGRTDDVGYVEFTFNDLESADQAKVTVTLRRMSPDDGHIYLSLRRPGTTKEGGDDHCRKPR
jgi:hypothetical protein